DGIREENDSCGREEPSYFLHSRRNLFLFVAEAGQNEYVTEIARQCRSNRLDRLATNTVAKSTITQDPYQTSSQDRIRLNYHDCNRTGHLKRPPIVSPGAENFLSPSTRFSWYETRTSPMTNRDIIRREEPARRPSLISQ